MSGVCICELNQDGQCPSCRQFISKSMEEFVDLFREYQDRIKTVVAKMSGGDKCSECARRYADWGMAKLLAVIGNSGQPKEALDESFKTLTRMLMGLGVTGFPLTLKAYKEVCWANGWDEVDLFT